MPKTEIRVLPNPCIRGLEIYVIRGTMYAADIEWRDVETVEGIYRPPTFVLDNDAAQYLMDNLFAAGFRPSEATGSAGQREALEQHLEDMRTIAFAKLEIESP
jgi:hypothetical protein